MRSKTQRRLYLFLAVVLVLAAAPAVLAAPGETDSGTTISNRATVRYSVGAIAQTPIESSPTGNTTPGIGNGTNTTFLVDNKVDLTEVTTDAAPVPVVPGAVRQVLTFTVANTGNTLQDYGLSYAFAASALGANSTTQVSVMGVFADGNANGTYDSTLDTANFVDELGTNRTRTVFLVADIPASLADGDVAAYVVAAQTRDGGGPGVMGAVTNQTGGADTPAVDVVWADGAGRTDGTRDGIFTAASAFRVASVRLTVTKTSYVSWDPFNLGVSPKAIPGARMHYTVTVLNSGSAAAQGLSVTDPIPANTAWYPGSLISATTGPGTAGTFKNGPPVTQVGGTCTTLPSAAGNNQFTLDFEVTIQ